MTVSNEPLKRFLVIADDYRWIAITPDVHQFTLHLTAHIEVLLSSKKENSYYIKNVFMTESDYQITLKTMKSNQEKQIVKARRVGHLRSVECDH